MSCSQQAVLISRQFETSSAAIDRRSARGSGKEDESLTASRLPLVATLIATISLTVGYEGDLEQEDKDWTEALDSHGLAMKAPVFDGGLFFCEEMRYEA